MLAAVADWLREGRGEAELLMLAKLADPVAVLKILIVEVKEREYVLITVMEGDEEKLRSAESVGETVTSVLPLDPSDSVGGCDREVLGVELEKALKEGEPVTQDEALLEAMRVNEVSEEGVCVAVGASL